MGNVPGGVCICISQNPLLVYIRDWHEEYMASQRATSTNRQLSLAERQVELRLAPIRKHRAQLTAVIGKLTGDWQLAAANAATMAPPVPKAALYALASKSREIKGMELELRTLTHRETQLSKRKRDMSFAKNAVRDRLYDAQLTRATRDIDFRLLTRDGVLQSTRTEMFLGNVQDLGTEANEHLLEDAEEADEDTALTIHNSSAEGQAIDEIRQHINQLRDANTYRNLAMLPSVPGSISSVAIGVPMIEPPPPGLPPLHPHRSTKHKRRRKHDKEVHSDPLMHQLFGDLLV